MPHFPVYTHLFWIPGTKHSNLQPLLIKEAATTTAPHHHHSNDSKYHTYFNPFVPGVLYVGRLLNLGLLFVYYIFEYS